MADYDDTDVRGRLLALEAEAKRLWREMDNLMRDQTACEKRLEHLEKGLKPAAEGSPQ